MYDKGENGFLTEEEALLMAVSACIRTWTLHLLLPSPWSWHAVMRVRCMPAPTSDLMQAALVLILTPRGRGAVGVLGGPC